MNSSSIEDIQEFAGEQNTNLYIHIYNLIEGKYGLATMLEDLFYFEQGTQRGL